MGDLVIVSHDHRPVRFRCHLCPWVGYAGEERAYENHVVACASAHADKIRADSPRTRLPFLYDPDHRTNDRELEEWIRRNGRPAGTGTSSI